jgi:hypothetical protein
MKQIKAKLIAVLIFSIASTISVAGASEAMLKRFFVEVNTLQADFSQQIVDERGTTLETKSGIF